jgi:hypothetical protein
MEGHETCELTAKFNIIYVKISDSATRYLAIARFCIYLNYFVP